MLYETPQLQVTLVDGVATLGLAFKGTPVNGLNLARIAELDRALDVVLAEPAVDVLVVRSLLPGGFCGGFTPHALSGIVDDTSASLFAAVGQRVLMKLVMAPFVSLAFVEGPCMGPGLELALACTYRLGQSCPDSAISLGDTPTGWGGLTRCTSLLGRSAARQLTLGPPLSAREAARIGLFDHGFSARRAKIELRTWLDWLQLRPRMRRRPGLACTLAAERAAFVDAMRTFVPPPSPPVLPESAIPVPPFPEVIELLGDEPQFAWLAAEVALRGRHVRWRTERANSIEAVFLEARRRGRATPLEVDQARKRISSIPLSAIGNKHDATPVQARLVVCQDVDAAIEIEAKLPPGCVLAVPREVLSQVAAVAARPGRVVGLTLGSEVSICPGEETSAETIAAVVSWFRTLGPVSLSSALADRNHATSTTSILRLV